MYLCCVLGTAACLAIIHLFPQLIIAIVYEICIMYFSYLEMDSLQKELFVLCNDYLCHEVIF